MIRRQGKIGVILGLSPVGFVADTVRGEKIFDRAKAQRKTVIQPNRVGDHLRREAMAASVNRPETPLAVNETLSVLATLSGE
jgi:hypothetical protein